MTGKMIVIDGIDGTGKSSVIKNLYNHFSNKYPEQKFITINDPSSELPNCKKIRELLLDKDIDLAPLAELHLYYASRLELLKKVIEPELEAGTIILCDRFQTSTIAYQEYGRGLGEKVSNLEQFMDYSFIDKYIIFDIDPVVGVKRSLKRNEDETGPDETKFENLNIDFFENARRGYLDFVITEPKAVFVDSQYNNIDELTDLCIEIITDIL